MRRYSRREILKLGALIATGLGLDSTHEAIFADGLEKIVRKQAKVLWLQALSCSGCSVSFLNADCPGPAEILTDVLSLVFHSNISAVQGDQVLEVIDRLTETGDYLLVVEGAVPANMPNACVIGGRTMEQLLPPILRNAKAIVAAGTCAAFGGVPAAEGSPSAATGLPDFMARHGIATQDRLVTCPGCPVHPQTLLGTVAYLAARGYPKVLPGLLAPAMFYSHSVHDECPRFHCWEKEEFAKEFGEEGCLFKLGCLGPLSHTTCPRRQWNGGVNWCVRAGAPCVGCTSEHFAPGEGLSLLPQGRGVSRRRLSGIGSQGWKIMKLGKITLLKKMAGAILGIVLLSSLVMFCVQHVLYSRNFETAFANLQKSTLDVKRDGARDILREIKIATQSSLARGEYAKFTLLADKQKELGEIQAFSFYNRQRKGRALV